MDPWRDVSLSLDPTTRDRHAYAGANPVGYVDADGHKRCSFSNCNSITGAQSEGKAPIAGTPADGSRDGGGGGGGTGGGSGSCGMMCVPQPTITYVDPNLPVDPAELLRDAFIDHESMPDAERKALEGLETGFNRLGNGLDDVLLGATFVTLSMPETWVAAPPTGVALSRVK